MLQQLLNVTIVIFMVSNLPEVRLRLKIAESLAALSDLRFVILTLLWCFVLGAAPATLMRVSDAPQGAITMCILAVFLGAILSGFAAAALLKRFCAPAGATCQEGTP